MISQGVIAPAAHARCRTGSPAGYVGATARLLDARVNPQPGDYLTIKSSRPISRRMRGYISYIGETAGSSLRILGIGPLAMI